MQLEFFFPEYTSYKITGDEELLESSVIPGEVCV